MRSRLEAHWARAFDLAGFIWTYEPDNYGDRTGQYFPDFLIRGRSGHIYVEIKPPLSPRELTVALRRMEIIWSSDPDATLWLIRLGPDDGWTVHCGSEGQWLTVGPELVWPYTDSEDHVSRSLTDLVQGLYHATRPPA